MAEVQKIKDMKAHFNVIFRNVFREGNIVADFIANTIFDFGGTTSFKSFHDLPNAGRTLINQTRHLRVMIARQRGHD